jgi:hypothetical protein
MTPQMSLASYASTSVTPARSKEQIEDLLIKVGAVGFRWSSRTTLPGEEILEAGLEWNGREVAFRLKVGYEDDQERKQRLRALYWYLKAKVEAIMFGLVDLEREFLPYLLTADGETVFDHLGGQNMRLLAAPNEPVEPEVIEP